MKELENKELELKDEELDQVSGGQTYRTNIFDFGELKDAAAEVADCWTPKEFGKSNSR